MQLQEAWGKKTKPQNQNKNPQTKHHTLNLQYLLDAVQNNSFFGSEKILTAWA